MKLCCVLDRNTEGQKVSRFRSSVAGERHNSLRHTGTLKVVCERRISDEFDDFEADGSFGIVGRKIKYNLHRI